MKCPKCGGSTSVTDSRHRTGNITYRHRVCSKCGYGFPTHETVYDRREEKARKRMHEAVMNAIKTIKAIDYEAH